MSVGLYLYVPMKQNRNENSLTPGKKMCVLYLMKSFHLLVDFFLQNKNIGLKCVILL